MAYLTAAQVRARITNGSPALDTGRFPDTWIDEQVEVFEAKLEHHTGFAYVSRSRVVTMSVRSYTTRLFLPDPLVTAITSITVDGTAIVRDTSQPSLDIGIVRYAYGFRPETTIVATYTCGYSATPTVVKVACARFVERTASLDRSGSTRDISRQGFDGGSTSYVMPDPDNGRLTGFDEVDSLVRTLDHFTHPRVA